MTRSVARPLSSAELLVVHCNASLSIDFCRHYKNEAEVMLEENWRVRLEELSFASQERRAMTRTGSRASLYRVSVKCAIINEIDTKLSSI